MDYRRNLPFYMGYPQYQDWSQINEDMLIEDLEYLQQMYPSYAKRYQTIINNYLDKMDYDGSLIYDQYPDRWQLERMVKTILNTIRNEENTIIRTNNNQDTNAISMPDSYAPENNISNNMTQMSENDKWSWIRELVTVLLYYEILKRRRKRKTYRYF